MAMAAGGVGEGEEGGGRGRGGEATTGWLRTGRRLCRESCVGGFFFSFFSLLGWIGLGWIGLGGDRLVRDLDLDLDGLDWVELDECP